MLYRAWQILIVATLSCVVGVNYTFYTWFDYEILGISNGKMATGLLIWGYLLLALGLVLFLTLILRKIINVKLMDKQLEIIIAIIFVLQLPMISLWFMAIFMQGKEAVWGVLLHHLVLGLSLYIFLSNQYRTNQSINSGYEADESVGHEGQ